MIRNEIVFVFVKSGVIFSDMKRNARSIQMPLERFGDRLVSNQIINISQIPYPPHRMTTELRVIGQKQDATRIADDRPGALDLAQIKVQQCSIIFDSTDADDAEFRTERRQGFDRAASQNGAILRTQLASGNDRMKIHPA
ncbi:hypothetical protein AA3990_1332 [Gluconobacter roseus NBRC 3990]|nr:hypothetical protein AA3990_1332 [Gluconobacter roseus NBRC 3990]